MARRFDPGSTSSIGSTTALATAAAFSWAAWFYPDTTGTYAIVSLTDKSSENDQNWLLYLATGTVNSSAKNSTGVQAADTLGYSTGAWQHACGVEAAANDRRVFLDGGNKGTNTTSTSPAGVDRTGIGFRDDVTPDLYFDGEIHAVSFWSSALSDAEAGELGAGRNPLTLSTFPSNHIPLLGGAQDVVGGVSFSENSVTAGAMKPLGW